MVVGLLLIGLATCTVCLYFYRKRVAHQFFVKEGIPGPKPHWLLGNVGELADETKRHLVLPTWTKNYGKVFGYYEGSWPMLVTSDVDVVTQIFVKQFLSFHSRKRFPVQPNPNSTTESINMIVANGDRWKRLRTIVSPTFSAAKMRALMPLMKKCQDDFMHLIDTKADAAGRDDESFDIFECLKMLTLDTISETAFGIELNSARTNNIRQNPVLATISQLLRSVSKAPLTTKIALVIPEASSVLRALELLRGRFGLGYMKQRYELLQMVTEIIEARKANKELQKRQDLLQMMLELEEEAGSSSAFMLEESVSSTAAMMMKGLSIKEITGQAMLFMIAGYETSSNALALSCFLLANHPRVQDKLIAEIDENFSPTNQHQPDNKAVDYDSVYDLPYLECVINEALRLYPIAPMVVNRTATDDTIVNGIRIPKGMTVTADIWSLHRDEEQWGPVDVETFYPERFLDDYPTKQSRSDAAFMPFGFGPRICIGMRFALLEIKLTLVNLLRKYRIEKTDRTGDSLKLTSAFTMTPADGVWVKLTKRA